MTGDIEQTREWNFISLSLLVLIGYSLLVEKLKISIRYHRQWSTTTSHALTALALAFLIVGFYNSYGTWQRNHELEIKARQSVAAANHQAANTHNKPGALATGIAPSTTQLDANALASYQVAPGLPRYLSIPKINVKARALSVGLMADGSIATPGSVFDTAWYNGSALPGQPGAMLIDGHISSWTSAGVFYNLGSLEPGDQLTVERGDGTKFVYHVVSVSVYNSASVNMTAALSPVNPGRPGLNLISCYGNVVKGTNDFSKRIVVFASE